MSVCALATAGRGVFFLSFPLIWREFVSWMDGECKSKRTSDEALLMNVKIGWIWLASSTRIHTHCTLMSHWRDGPSRCGWNANWEREGGGERREREKFNSYIKSLFSGVFLSGLQSFRVVITRDRRHSRRRRPGWRGRAEQVCEWSTGTLPSFESPRDLSLSPAVFLSHYVHAVAFVHPLCVRDTESDTTAKTELARLCGHMV